MRTIFKCTGALAILLILSQGMAKAQDSLRISPFHLSFITPLGTNGLQSWNTVNRISINLFAGYSAGVKGVELAGFTNVLNGDMDGIQVAGFSNNTFGEANGMEIAGFSNLNRGRLNGFQLSGFANVALDSVIGVQAAGFANVTTGTQKGLQASGFFNYARRLRGVQVGVVNIADTVESGLPIGFLSFVRHGYRVIQIGGSETLYGEISFKTGVRRFHNILSLGTTIKDQKPLWGFGYGIGTLIPLGRRLDIGIEGLSYYLSGKYWFSGYLNSLNRLNLSLCYNLAPAIGAYAGVSWNVLITDNSHYEGWYRHFRDPEVEMYPGFTAGIRIGI
jgi:hypothetical protein